MADRGTLFLDAIEALPLPAQDRLLALLARGRIARVHSREQGVADVRVVAGTAIDLRDAVRAGAFREELFYRLRALEIHLPPLRDRPEDVPMLAYAFLRTIREETGRDVRRISAEALRLLGTTPGPATPASWAVSSPTPRPSPAMTSSLRRISPSHRVFQTRPRRSCSMTSWPSCLMSRPGDAPWTPSRSAIHAS